MQAGSFSYDLNLSILFADLPLLERPRAAARAGFTAVEMWWPYATPSPKTEEMGRLLRALEEAGTQLVMVNLYGGDLTAGVRGILSHPERGEEFAAGIESAMWLAGRAGCRALNALYGNRLPRMDPEAQDDLAVERLVMAAETVAAIEAVVMVEALNTFDNPDYGVTSSKAALELLERVTARSDAQVAFLADLYHLARMGEDLEQVLTVGVGRIGHVQVADVPGRHQPGSGELGVTGLLEPLRRAGYDGWVGLEYVPLGPTDASLAWCDLKRHES